MPGPEVARCTGHCCEEFPLPEPLNYFQTHRDRIQDGDKIADMLVFKGVDQYKDGATSYLYTCIHFDRVTRDCKDYANRPRMCSDYPYGRPCEHKECTEGSKPDVPLSRFNLKSLNIR